MIYKTIVLVFLFCLTATAQAYGPLRCQGKIINPGDSTEEVLDLCGAPKRRIIEQTPVRVRTLSGFSRLIGVTATEFWVYDRGYGRFPAMLKFQDGKLRRIDYGPRRSGN